MTSGTPFPVNLTAIDQLTRPDHSYLTEQDRCYFLGEYTARKGFAYSDTNSLILNLKKPMDRQGRPEWVHKGRAILRAAKALRNAINNDWLESATFVPIPPSKAKGDPMHDDRMTKIIERIITSDPVDCREVIVQAESTDAAHESDHRPGPAEIAALYSIDEDLAEPPPAKIVILDDVLTTGSHFKAAQSVLAARFPEIPIVGCFVARRVPEAIDIEEFFDDIEF